MGLMREVAWRWCLEASTKQSDSISVDRNGGCTVAAEGAGRSIGRAGCRWACCAVDGGCPVAAEGAGCWVCFVVDSGHTVATCKVRYM